MVKFPHYYRDKRREMHRLFAPLEPRRGAEIGVWNGNTSRSLLNRFPDLRLYLVDRWTPPPPGDSWATTDDRFAGKSQREHDDAYQHTLRVTGPFGLRVAVRKMSSVAAAATVLDDDLDFVFIDADHSYVGALADIRAWWPKVRRGGIVSGDDFDHESHCGFGVRKAVEECCKAFGSAFVVDSLTDIWSINK